MNLANPSSTRHIYTDEFKQKALQHLEKGQSLRQVAGLLSISKNSLLRWKHQSKPDTAISDSTTLSRPVDTNELGAKSGNSTDQLETSLYSPNAVIQNRFHSSTATNQQAIFNNQPKDRRRLYNDAFKQEALLKINSGISIRQLSRTLGVSQVTLHKWRNAAESTTTRPEITEPNSYAIDLLHAKLRALEEERDILKKALFILLRPD